jgi:hypothetical protein
MLYNYNIIIYCECDNYEGYDEVLGDVKTCIRMLNIPLLSCDIRLV